MVPESVIPVRRLLAKVRTEYLQKLITRHRWKNCKLCASPGDIVLVKDKTAERNEWLLGRITSVIRCADGLVRTVEQLIPSPGGIKPAKLEIKEVTESVLLIPHESHIVSNILPLVNPKPLGMSRLWRTKA